MNSIDHFTDMYDDPDSPHARHRVLSGVAWAELAVVGLLIVAAFAGFWYALVYAVLRV